jgi:hypothetical protein
MGLPHSRVTAPWGMLLHIHQSRSGSLQWRFQMRIPYVDRASGTRLPFKLDSQIPEHEEGVLGGYIEKSPEYRDDLCSWQIDPQAVGVLLKSAPHAGR